MTQLSYYQMAALLLTCGGIAFLLGFAMGDRFGYFEGYRDGRQHDRKTRN